MSALISGDRLAFHFVGDTLRDGRPVPPDGEWLEHDGPVEICASGLHASRRPWHALAYAPGPVLCVVEVDGIVTEQNDKLVARRRRIVRRVDLTADMRAFTRQCALDVIRLWEAPDVVRRYLETGDESLRAAARAAAVWDAVKSTWIAAKKAAWDAARTAVWDDAAWAAWDLAWAAAWDAARAVAWDAVVRADATPAARVDATPAAWAAARNAAWAAYGERFDALCAARLEEVRL